MLKLMQKEKKEDRRAVLGSPLKKKLITKSNPISQKSILFNVNKLS